MYADRNAEELIGRDDSKGKFEEQKQETKKRPANKISTTTVAKNTDVSAEETDVSRPWPDLSSENSSEREVSMKNWKTYRNEELGIEFKYPKDWTPDDISNSLYKRISVRNPINPEFGFTIFLPIPEMGYELWTSTKKEKFILDGLEATKNFLQGHQGVSNNFILVRWNFDDYENSGQITFNYPKKGASNRFELIFDQILKSFKFLPKE